MTNEEFEARRNASFIEEIGMFIEKLGEPEHFITFDHLYYDLYAVYAEGKGEGRHTIRYCIYEDPYFGPDEMRESSISFDAGSYVQSALFGELVRTMVAAYNHQDEPIEDYYDCLSSLVVHEKGWRPQVTENPVTIDS